MDEYRNDGANGFVMTDATGTVSDTADTMTLNGEEGLRVDPVKAAEQTAEFERVEAEPAAEQHTE